MFLCFCVTEHRVEPSVNEAKLKAVVLKIPLLVLNFCDFGKTVFQEVLFSRFQQAIMKNAGALNFMN